MRALHWRALAAGVACAVLLVSPWLYHEATTGFDDVSVLLPGGDAVNAPADEPSVTEAIRHTVRMLGLGDWEYVSADSLPSFVDDAGPVVWKAARGASILAALLFAVGFVSCAICVVRTSRRVSGWPWLALTRSGATRALFLVWLVGVWVVYSTPAADRLFPHYLIVTFPVSFAVVALGLADLTAMARLRLRSMATVACVGALAAIAVANTVFTLAFHRTGGPLATTASSTGTRRRSRTPSERGGCESRRGRPRLARHGQAESSS